MTAVKTIRELSAPFIGLRLGNKRKLSVCFAVEENESPVAAAEEAEESSRELERKIIESFTVAGGNRAEERMARKKTERFTYLVAAVMSSFGITSMAVFAVYSRFAWQMEVQFLHAYVELILFIFRYAFSTLKRICIQGGEVPHSEMLATFSLAFGAAVSNLFLIQNKSRSSFLSNMINLTYYLSENLDFI